MSKAARQKIGPGAHDGDRAPDRGEETATHDRIQHDCASKCKTS